MFTGEPTLARGVIAEESSILVLPPDALRALVASSTELGDLLLRTMIMRREWLKGQGYGNELLIGKRSSGDAFAIRELLERNLVPFSWHDIETTRKAGRCLTGWESASTSAPFSFAPTACCGVRRSRRSPTSSVCAPRSIRGPSTPWCSGRALPGWPPLCTPPPRAFPRWSSSASPREGKREPAIGSRTTLAFRPVCPGQT